MSRFRWNTAWESLVSGSPSLQSSLRSNPREFYFAYFSTWIGFLAGHEVKQKGALNAGLREWLDYVYTPQSLAAYGFVCPVDQQFALKWIQRNVCIPA